MAALISKIAYRIWIVFLWSQASALAVVSFIPFFGLEDYRFDIISHFRVQYAVGCLIILCLALFSRRRKLRITVGVLLGVNLWQVLYWPTTEEPSEGGESYTVMSFNIFMGNAEVDSLLAYIADKDPDILFLIETAHHWRNVVQPLREAYPYHLVRYGSHENGVAFFSKYPLDPHDSTVTRAIARLQLPQGEVLLVGCHPPAPRSQRHLNNRNQYLDNVAQFASEQQMPTIVLGDFNASPWAPHFKGFWEESGLTLANQNLWIYPTWPAHDPFLWVPIDHFLSRNGIAVTSVQRGEPTGSDHYPLLVEFQIEQELAPELSE